MESAATYGLQRLPCHSNRSNFQTAMLIVSISFPRPERFRNATSTILRICLCARTDDCVSLRTGSEIYWMLPRRDTQSLTAAVTGRVLLPGRLPDGQKYERLADSMQAVVARLHRAVYQGPKLPSAGPLRSIGACGMSFTLQRWL